MNISDHVCYKCGLNFELVKTNRTHKFKHTHVNTYLNKLHCNKCNEVLIPAMELQKYEMRVAKQAFLSNDIDGPIMKFARKAIGLKREELAKKLNVSAEDIAQWEQRENLIDKSIIFHMRDLLNNSMEIL